MDTLPVGFRGGRNLALKVPASVFEAALGFYRDTLKLPLVDECLPSHVFEFGANRLWLDRVEGLAQAELWLEIETGDTTAAQAQLTAQGVDICNEIETLPAGFDGFWIRSPSQTVHLVCGEQA